MLATHCYTRFRPPALTYARPYISGAIHVLEKYKVKCGGYYAGAELERTVYLLQALISWANGVRLPR